VALIVRLLATPSVAENRVAIAERAVARQLRQADLNSYPGSALSSVAGNAIKRITAGVKARRWSNRQSFEPATGLHPPARTSVERKKNARIRACRMYSILQIGRLKTTKPDGKPEPVVIPAVAANDL
jgi:hypothetical protein